MSSSSASHSSSADNNSDDESGPRYGKNAITKVNLDKGSIVYGYGFSSPGDPDVRNPLNVVSAATFEMMRGYHPPFGRHPLTRRPFQYLRSVPPPTDKESGYVTYRLSGDKETLQEIQEPTNAVIGPPNASSSAAAAAANVAIGPPIPVSTLAQSVRDTSWHNIASSVVFGTPVYTGEMRRLLEEIAGLSRDLRDVQMHSSLQGHGHGSQNFEGYMAASTRIRNYRAALARADDQFQRLYAIERDRYVGGGGRLGVVSACLGAGDRFFLETELGLIQRRLNAIQPDVEEQARGMGTMATGLWGLYEDEISGLTARQTNLRQQLAALPREEGEGCKVSRKSRQRKSRQRKSRQRRSRATRRR
jgi:hypothetical protein